MRAAHPPWFGSAKTRTRGLRHWHQRPPQRRQATGGDQIGGDSKEIYPHHHRGRRGLRSPRWESLLHGDAVAHADLVVFRRSSAIITAVVIQFLQRQRCQAQRWEEQDRSAVFHVKDTQLKNGESSAVQHSVAEFRFTRSSML